MYIDVKETIWHRLQIPEQYQIKVFEMLLKGKTYENVCKMLDDNGVDIGVEYLFDTCESLTPEQNNGKPTVELFDDNDISAWNNTEEINNKKMKSFKVDFHRTYEIPMKKVLEYLEHSIYDIETLTESDLKVAVERIARDWLSDEMPEFLDNTEDFVSATVKIIEI